MQSTQSFNTHTNHRRVSSLNKPLESDGLVRHHLSRELGISKGQLVVLKNSTLGRSSFGVCRPRVNELPNWKRLIQGRNLEAKHSFPDSFKGMHIGAVVGKLGIRTRKNRAVTKYAKYIPKSLIRASNMGDLGELLDISIYQLSIVISYHQSMFFPVIPILLPCLICS